MRIKHLVVILALVTTGLLPAPAHAGGVVTVCDEAHLLAALAGGGTVTFSCSGVITLTETITIDADTTIDGSGQEVTISGNNAVRVFTVNLGVAFNLNAVTVANGRAYTGGGMVKVGGGATTVSNSTFTGNSAGSGGAIVVREYGTLTVSNSTFTDNSADNGGGGIEVSGGMLTVSNSTFTGNSAEWGGGIAKWDGTVEVSNSTFTDNSANNGGGIYSNFGGTLTVSNSTFSGNRSYHEGGGGIYSGYNSTLTVSNSTFAGNSANRDGGGISHVGSDTVTLKNTIVANSPSGGNCSGTIVDGGGNLSFPDATCPGLNADPKLGPLQDNGGPTHTMDLGPGSAAFEAGDNITCAAAPVNNLDQRGVSRPQGARCDIGAVEHLLPFRMWLPTILAQ